MLCYVREFNTKKKKTKDDGFRDSISNVPMPLTSCHLVNLCCNSSHFDDGLKYHQMLLFYYFNNGCGERFCSHTSATTTTTRWNQIIIKSDYET